MRKYTLKELKNLVKIGAAKDITGFDFDQMKDRKTSCRERVCQYV